MKSLSMNYFKNEPMSWLKNFLKNKIICGICGIWKTVIFLKTCNTEQSYIINSFIKALFF